MDCLANRIGLRGDGTTPDPAPVLFINDLPGITLSNVDAQSTDEDGQNGFAEVWRKVKQAANKKFDVFLRAAMNNCCQLTGDVVKCIVCHADNAGLFDVALWYLYGCELMIFRTSTDAMNRYTTIDLDKAEKLKEEFYLEFQGSLSDAVKSVTLDVGQCLGKDCVESNDGNQFVFQL